MAAGPEWWVSEGGKMRYKLKGKMADSAVILPKATKYAGPLGPDFLTRRLGKG